MKDSSKKTNQELIKENSLLKLRIKELEQSESDLREMEEKLHVHRIQLEMQNEELHHAKAELESSRARYFDLYDLAPVGYCTLSEKGLILETNLAAAALLGVIRGALVKQPLTRFILHEDLNIYYQHNKQLFETHQPQKCELRMVRRNETIFWAHLEAIFAQDANGLPVCRVAINDNPERKRAEEEVRGRLRFEMLFSYVSTRFTDISNLQIDVEIERALKDILEFFEVDRVGLLKVSIEDQSWRITHAAYGDGILPLSIGIDLPIALLPWIYERIIRKHETISFSTLEELPEEADTDRQTYLKWGVQSCLNILIKRGKDHLYIVFLNAVKNKCSWPDNYVSRLRLLAEIMVNALERRRIETEALISRRELLKKERIFQMGELTASLAHELNQPLMAILSNARAALRFMQNDMLDLEELKEILEDIVSDDKRAGDIIRSLRSMVKPEEGERELIVIDTVLREAISIFNSEAIIRNIKVETDYDDSKPLVYIDKVQLQQVVINLMMNAAESMINVMQNRRIVIQTRETEGKRVCVAVRDFGSAIEEKENNRIFESFFTTKSSGIGMGLSLSRSIVEIHGGHIWFENNLDCGSTFFFDLPLAAGELK